MTVSREPEAVARQLVVEAADDFVMGLTGAADADLIAAVAEAADPVMLGSGEVLFEAGDRADAAYFVVTGRTAVVGRRDNGEFIIGKRGRGSLIGEIALIDDAPRTAGIRAERDSLLARLPRRVFDELAVRFPEFQRGVTRLVVDRLARAQPTVEQVTTIAIVTTHPGVDPNLLVDGIAAAAVRGGPVTVLEGVGGAPMEQDRVLDEAEARHRFVLLPISIEMTDWDKRALRHADRVLVVTEPSPSGESAAMLEDVVAAANSVCHGVTWILVACARTHSDPVAADMRGRYGVERVLRFDPTSRGEVERVGRLSTGLGVGLVLGGGGARGFAHLGVFRVLEDLGIPIDAVAGSSIGAVFSATIALDFPRQEREQMVRTAFRRVLDYTFPSVGLIKARRLTRKLETHFGELDMQDLRRPCMCVSSDLTTSRLKIHDSGPLVEAVRASLAIPGIIPPVPHEGSLLVDAGVLNNLPVDVMRSSGLVSTVIAVDVSPLVGPGAHHDFGLSVSGWRAMFNKLLPGPRKYPRLSAILLRSMLVGSMRERDRLIEAGLADLYLDLDLRGISMLDFSRPTEAIRRGEDLARDRVVEWLDATRPLDPPSAAVQRAQATQREAAGRASRRR